MNPRSALGAQRAAYMIAAICLLLVVWGCDQRQTARASGGDLTNPTSPDALAPADVSTPRVVVSIAPTPLAQRLDPRFLSITIDTSRAVRARYDFAQPKLVALASQFAPLYLRIGGTEADRVYYDLSEIPVTKAPEGYAFVLDREIWQRSCSFARQIGARLLFTINAGPGPRDEKGRWQPDNARELIRYSRQIDCPVAVWELGNEPGSFIFEHGFTPSGESLARDLATFHALVKELDPGALVAGPTVAFWPLLGEVLTPVLAGFLEHGADVLDIVTWHYYPQQSRNCPVSSRLAKVDTMLVPSNLDELAKWAGVVESLRDKYAPGLPVWLGETGHAQCGGEPGVSDRFVTGFWWLDELGAIALRGQPVVMRQTLIGGNYTLVSLDTLEPAPDYFNSLLFKRLMGLRVLRASAPDRPKTLRLYAHCSADRLRRPGAVTLLALNLEREASVTLDFPAALGVRRQLYLATAPDLLSPRMLVNGKVLYANADGSVPEIPGRAFEGPLTLPPTSYAFVVFEDAGLAGCR